MAIAYKDVQIPLAAGHPMAMAVQHPEDYYFGMRIYYDDAWPGEETGRTIVAYFHGSGATAYLTGPLLNELIAKGYPVAATMNLGSPQSSENPFRFGYGNVNAPHFYSSFIKLAWWPRAAVEYLIGQYGSDIVLCGHSAGGTASLAFTSRNFHPLPVPPQVKGVFSSGATVGGLGNGSWNDVMRNISTMSAVIDGLRLRTIVAAGDADAFGPPDYQRRIQLGYKEGSEVYFVSPGNLGHDWTNSSAGAPLAAGWVDQLAKGQTILNRHGLTAVRGAFIEA